MSAAHPLPANRSSRRRIWGDRAGAAPVSSAPATRTTTAQAPSTAARLPDSAGKALVQKTCGKQCHNLDVVTSQRYTREEWKRVVDAMAARGATGTGQELSAMTDYLARHFGR